MKRESLSLSTYFYLGVVLIYLLRLKEEIKPNMKSSLS